MLNFCYTEFNNILIKVKVAQSCLTLQRYGLYSPWNSPGQNTGVFAPCKKSYDQPAAASRDITLPTKVHLFKTMVFPVVIYGCESWTIKEAES